MDGRLVGCTPEYFEVTRLEIERGRLLTAVDIEQRHNFCVLAAKLAERLFPYEDPLGRRIFLPESLDYFEVVGICKYRSPTAAIGGSLSAQDFPRTSTSRSPPCSSGSAISSSAAAAVRSTSRSSN